MKEKYPSSEVVLTMRKVINKSNNGTVSIKDTIKVLHINH